MKRYLRDMRGRVVKAPQYSCPPLADTNPEGRAAKRRRKQMARKNPSHVWQATAESSEVPRADRQEIAPTWEEAGRPPMMIGDDLEDELAARLKYEQYMQLVSALTDEQRARLAAESMRAVGLGPDAKARMAEQYTELQRELAQVTGVDGGATLTWTDENGIQQRHVPESELRFPVEQGKVTLGVDPGSPEGDVTTVAIRRGNQVLVIDDYGPVPPEAWEQKAREVVKRLDERTATELGGGTLPLMNRARALAKSGARHNVVLAALLAATMPTKPKE